MLHGQYCKGCEMDMTKIEKLCEEVRDHYTAYDDNGPDYCFFCYEKSGNRNQDPIKRADDCPVTLVWEILDEL